MAWRQLVEQGGSAVKQVATSSAWVGLRQDLRTSLFNLGSHVNNLTDGGMVFQKSHKRFMSGYMSGFSRRLEQLERESSKYGAEDKHAAVLRELNKVDPEGVIRWFESQSAAHRSPAALAEYVKALVKVDRLDQSALFKTLQRGASALGGEMRADSMPSLAGASPVLGNVGMVTKDGVLGTPNAPIHMITAEGGLKVQAWRTLRTLALGFLLLSGVGALIEDRGIGKGFAELP